ncbi:MAG: hypothetical protein JRG94_18850 [Deltaproteobacteria bacterium]|nr:hypothetical protein [Deltaproteobacteria bacterium]MBW2294346.1 hypothetical protein [Deltaproteobacteria bacterium]
MAKSAPTSERKIGRKIRRKVTKKSTWGGRRPGAGRPKGSGSGPSPDSRRNRVAVMFSDTELTKLRALAKKRKIPIATAAYLMIERSLKRA